MSAVERAYFASPVPLQHLLISAYGLLLYRRRNAGPELARFMNEIAAWEAMTQREVIRAQDQLLRRTIIHAANKVPYYRDLFRRAGIRPETIDSAVALRQLPLLDKDALRTSPHRFVAENSRHTLKINTSGTTGSPISVVCTREALRRNYAHFYRLRETLGIAMRDRCATFAGRTIVSPKVQRPPFWRHNFVTNTLLFSTYHMSPATVPYYLERLAQFQPAMIDSYPSALGLLASFLAEDVRLSIRPRAIITSSETLLPWQRRAAEAAFGCKITDQYGAAEMVAFIAQCPRGTYHVWPSYGLCEIIVGDRPARAGESGELVCTGFINEAMPLIRYRTGDTAVAGEGCGCGLPYPTIAAIEGRKDDIIVTPEGRRVGRLDPVFKGVDDDAFREAQIVQEALDRVELRYVRGARFSDPAVQKVKNELSKRLGPGMRIDTREVTQLSRGRNGKLQAVVSLVSRPPTSEKG